MNAIKRYITECSIYIIYNFSGIELNNEVSRITSILLCGEPVCVNIIHNVMTTTMPIMKYVWVLNTYFIPNSGHEKESCIKLSQCVNVNKSIKVDVLVALLSYIIAL